MLETFDDGVLRLARGAHLSFYGLNEDEEEWLTLFVSAGKDRAKQINFVVWHGVHPSGMILDA